MPSPFPGMDPYLEHPHLWPDVHQALINAIRILLASQVAPRYFIAVEERVYVEAADPRAYIGRPDISIIGETMMRYTPAPAAPTERPITIELPVTDQIRERYLEIRDAGSRELITVIEMLSPANKIAGEGRQQYLRKRQRVLDALTSFVEFDLLRGGEPMDYGKIPPTHYRILVSHSWKRPHALLYPFNLSEAIPEIPIPLRADDQEPHLALGNLLAQVYDQVRYDLRIDYTAEPTPPLDSATAEWANKLLREGGRR
ncbi:MAG: DUF4058 family protein [Chloroflexota bacterium]